MKKKLYLVKREVYASSFQEATTKKGEIYEVVLADDKYQPQDEIKPIGFQKKK